MRRGWVAAMVLAGVVVATEAYADTVHLKDGRSYWATEVYEEGNEAVVVRPGETLRFPKAEVERIERLRSTLPPFYIPPGAEAPAPPSSAGAPPTPPGEPGTPAAAAPAGAPGPAAPSGGSSAQPSPPGAAPALAPGTASAPAAPGTGPTALPPPPPPPPTGPYR